MKLFQPWSALRALLGSLFGGHKAAPAGSQPPPDPMPLPPATAPDPQPAPPEVLALAPAPGDRLPEPEPAGAVPGSDAGSDTDVMAQVPAPAPPEPPPPEAPAAAAPMLRPDPEAEALGARQAVLEAQVAELAARRAEMEEQVQQFEIHQYRALGDILGECLRLRQALLDLLAARSGNAEDAAAQARARAEWEAYAEASTQTAERPPLDEAEEAELKRRYRAAAMVCHPDRVGEARRDLAHDLFLRVQQAYRQGDLEALEDLIREIEGQLGGDPAGPAAAGGGAGKKRISALQIQAADLILAIQTRQLDPNYRRACQPEEWEPYFREARLQFVAECQTLRSQIAILGGAA